MTRALALLFLLGCGSIGLHEGAPCGDKHGAWCESFTASPTTLFECKDGTWQAYLSCDKCELLHSDAGAWQINCQHPEPVR